MINEAKIVTPSRGAVRAVDFPWAYGLSEGTYELTSGQRATAGKYSASAWAFACMRIRGTELGGLPWQLKRNDKVLTSHPIINMLKKFGPESNYADAMLATEIDMLLHGAGYWLRDVDILKRLNPSTIKVVKTSSGIEGFEQYIGGVKVNDFEREEVAYFREYDPDDDLDAGTSVMSVVKGAMETEKQSLRYVNAFFKNDATPSMLLSTPKSLGTAAMEKVLMWWNTKFKGVRNKGKIAIADNDLKAQILSHSLKDNAFIEIREQARDDICTGMQVPKVLLSMADATYANASEARKFLIEDLIIPRSVYFAGVINHDIIQQIDPGVEFSFAPELLAIMQEDADSKWARLSKAVEQGIITEEFAREQMNWPQSAAPEINLKPEQETLRAWRRKSLKAVKAGKEANVEFNTDEVAMSRQLAIRANLAGANTPEAVWKVFSDIR